MRAEFDEYAQTYSELLKDPLRDGFASSDHFFARRKLAIIRDFFRRHGKDTREISWIDVGCGQGDLIRSGQSYFSAVAGCDPSTQMLEQCRGLEIRHQEAPNCIPFDDESFELVTAACVYHHVDSESREALTREVLRVLKPGGILCIIEHNPFNPITQIIVRRCPVDQQAHLLSARIAREIFRATRIELVETRYFLYLPERIYHAFSLLEDQMARIPLGGQFAIFGRKP